MRSKKGPEMNGRFKGVWPARPLLAGLALFALLVLVAVSCGGTAGEQRANEPVEDKPQAEAEKTQSGTDEEQAAADLENPSSGSESAPVVMIEYADFQ